MNYIFINKDDKYYVSNGEEVILLNEENFYKVRSSIELPATVYFHNCPVSFIGDLVDKLFDETPDLQMKRIKSEGVDSFDYEVSFEKSKEMSDRSLK